jgi:uncharacterized SAM-binding protein YcdF (DUF218 family)
VFFFFSKILDILFSPLTWAILLCLSGVFARNSRLTKGAPFLAAVVLCLFSMEPVSNRLVRWTEASAPRTYRTDTKYDAVIVLGGLLEHRQTASTGALSYNDGVERLLVAYDLLRTDRARYAVLSGGTDGKDDPIVESRELARQLESWGIARERLLTEGGSRNTRENAGFSARLVRDHKLTTLVLITSAAHMPRALAAFQAEGLSPYTFPVDYRGFDPEKADEKWLPRAQALAASTSALREMMGRAVYGAVSRGR